MCTCILQVYIYVCDHVSHNRILMVSVIVNVINVLTVALHRHFLDTKYDKCKVLHNCGTSSSAHRNLHVTETLIKD